VKVGVFDSGVGGQSVAQAIARAIPELDIELREDKGNLPYGNKSPEELLRLTTPIFTEMVEAGCSVIVVACNTVTTTIISELRKVITVPLIGMEPMVKPAAEMTKSNVIAVCATPATLASGRYSWLKQTYAAQTNVLEPDCSDWAFMIETNQVDRTKIIDRIESVLAEGVDVIVLGCTHYHWIEQEIKDICQDRATVLQPEGPVIAELTRVLAQLS